MGDPRFRRNLILVAIVHLLALLAFVVFTKREIKKPAGEVVWMDPGAFAQATGPAGEPESPEPTPEPTP